MSISPFSVGAIIESLRKSDWKKFPGERLDQIVDFLQSCDDGAKWAFLGEIAAERLKASDLDPQFRSALYKTQVEAIAHTGKPIDLKPVMKLAQTEFAKLPRVSGGGVQIALSPRLRTVLTRAHDELAQFGDEYVSTEHLLLGLIKLGQGVAVNVLQKMGLDLETVRMEVEKQVGTGPDQKMIGNIPYTPRVKKVLALAAKEAKALNHTYVGTEHILLGLLREGDGVAARVLKNLDVDIDDAYQVLLKFESGALGHLLVDVIARSPVRYFRLCSERATIEWDATGTKQVRIFRAGGDWEIIPEPERIQEPGYVYSENPYIDEMRDFIAACRQEKPWGYTLAEDKATLDLLQNIEASSDERKQIDV